jgi:hypothetical protein
MEKKLTARLMLAITLLAVGCHGVYAADEGLKKTKTSDRKKSDAPGWAFWRRSKPEKESANNGSKKAYRKGGKDSKGGKDCKKDQKVPWGERRRNRDRSAISAEKKSEVTDASNKGDFNKKSYKRRGKGKRAIDSSGEKSGKKDGSRRGGRRRGRSHGSKGDKGSGRKSRWNKKRNKKSAASTEKSTESKSE